MGGEAIQIIRPDGTAFRGPVPDDINRLTVYGTLRWSRMMEHYARANLDTELSGIREAAIGTVPLLGIPVGPLYIRATDRETAQTVSPNILDDAYVLEDDPRMRRSDIGMSPIELKTMTWELPFSTGKLEEIWRRLDAYEEVPEGLYERAVIVDTEGVPSFIYLGCPDRPRMASAIMTGGTIPSYDAQSLGAYIVADSTFLDRGEHDPVLKKINGDQIFEKAVERVFAGDVTLDEATETRERILEMARGAEPLPAMATNTFALMEEVIRGTWREDFPALKVQEAYLQVFQ